MKIEFEDLWYFLIWFPWELLLTGICAVKGWPFNTPHLAWLVVGYVAAKIWEIRKDLML